MKTQQIKSRKKRRLNKCLVLMYYSVKLSKNIGRVEVIGCSQMMNAAWGDGHAAIPEISLQTFHDDMLRRRSKKPSRNLPCYPLWSWYSDKYFEVLENTVRELSSNDDDALWYVEPAVCRKRPGVNAVKKLHRIESQSFSHYLKVSRKEVKKFETELTKTRQWCEAYGKANELSMLGAYFIYAWRKLVNPLDISCVYYRRSDKPGRKEKDLYTTEINMYGVEWVKVILSSSENKRMLNSKDKEKISGTQLKKDSNKHTELLIETMNIQLGSVGRKNIIFPVDEWAKVMRVGGLTVSHLNESSNESYRQFGGLPRSAAHVEKVTITVSDTKKYPGLCKDDVLYSFREGEGHKDCSWSKLLSTLKNMKRRGVFNQAVKFQTIVLQQGGKRSWRFVPSTQVDQYECYISKSLASRDLKWVYFDCDIAQNQLQRQSVSHTFESKDNDNLSSLFSSSSLFRLPLRHNELLNVNEVVKLMGAPKGM